MLKEHVVLDGNMFYVSAGSTAVLKEHVVLDGSMF